MRVGVVGAEGRMGQEVCRAVDAAADLDLAARVDIDDDLATLASADIAVAVDFTTPSVVANNVDWYLTHDIHAVVGTTGWDDDDLKRWRELCANGTANVVVAPNFALGAVLMMHFSRIAARQMPHAEVIELHHDGKADAPSGTALMTADDIARSRSEAPPTVLGETHEGARGADRHGVRVHAVRLPGLVAHQEVLFGAQGQTLSIRHDTVDRTAFMPGVLLAVREVDGRRGVTVGIESLLNLESPS